MNSSRILAAHAQASTSPDGGAEMQIVVHAPEDEAIGYLPHVACQLDEGFTSANVAVGHYWFIAEEAT